MESYREMIGGVLNSFDFEPINIGGEAMEREVKRLNFFWIYMCSFSPELG